NAAADVARERARRAAGLKEPADAKESAQEDKNLEELLEGLANAGLETLERDLRRLEDRLKKGEKGDKGDGAPTGDDVRDLAKRLDSLRKAMERAAAGGAEGDKDLLRKLRSLGNEELLDKVAERLRKIAARMDRGQKYEDLESEAEDSKDLSEMSE